MKYKISKLQAGLKISNLKDTLNLKTQKKEKYLQANDKTETLSKPPVKVSQVDSI
ncbi:MAG: hypothetical protein ACOH2V_00300 [Candidatus Saccharimonadaceae bacterium]